MRFLYLFVLIPLTLSTATAAEPRLLVSDGDGGGCANPVYAPDGLKIAFADAERGVIRLWEPHARNSLTDVVRGEGVGRRFVFEPGQVRIVYRLRIQSLPDKPERLYSISLYMHDPSPRSANLKGDLYGPYLIDSMVWYRPSLTAPYFSSRDSARHAGPYLDQATGRLWVLNDAGDTVFTSSPGQSFAGMEISPDGQWVAAVESAPARRLHVIHIADGKTLTADGVAPSWALHVPRVVFNHLSTDGPAEIRVMNLPEGRVSTILRDARFRPEMPALSPDGRRAAFVSDGSLYEVDISESP